MYRGLVLRADCRDYKRRQRGFSLVELIVFIVVVSIAMVAIIAVFNQSVVNSVDPVLRIQMSELAQSQLDEILARKYDEATPSGSVPACGSAETGAVPCAGIGLDAGESLTAEVSLDDVDDFHGYSDTPYSGFTRSVSVILAGADLGIPMDQAKRITVTVTAPGNQQLSLSTYRVNF